MVSTSSAEVTAGTAIDGADRLTSRLWSSNVDMCAQGRETPGPVG
jgi:hypothetical protein